MTYERYNLKSNPFLEESPDFKHIDRDDVEGELRRDLRDAIEAGGCQILVLLGDYGIGKTFTLLWLLDKVRKSEFPGGSAGSVLGVYFKVAPPKPPAGYTTYVYSRIVDGIGFRTLRKYLRQLRETAPEGQLGVQPQLAGLDEDYRNALSRLEGSLGHTAWAYLKGERLKQAELTQLEVQHSISGDNESELALMNLLKLLHIAGCGGVLVFIDELEYIFSVASGKKVAQVMNTFKDLYDKITEAIIAGTKLTSVQFVFASTPSAWGDLMPKLMRAEAPAITALWERVFRDPTILRPFIESEAGLVIEDRLNKRRLKPSDDPFAPFDPAVIQLIRDLSDGVPRRIIRLCAYALIEAVELNAEVVDETIIRHVYEYSPWARPTRDSEPAAD